MPKYFFSLTDTAWPLQPGEELSDDEMAMRHAEAIADELARNGDQRPNIKVFDQSGRRVA